MVILLRHDEVTVVQCAYRHTGVIRPFSTTNPSEIFTSMTPARLPILKAPENAVDDIESPGLSGFSIDLLAWALQQNLSLTKIGSYLKAFPPEAVESKLSFLVGQYPPIFYAVERNNAAIVRLLIELGQNPNTRSMSGDVPILAFAIFHAENEMLNATEVVKTLLGLGAHPKVIPQDMWKNPIQIPDQKLPEVEPNTKSDRSSSKSSWCTKKYRAAIARNINLTQRYFLEKAYRYEMLSKRKSQVARAWNITPLLEMPFHLVGQLHATDIVMSSLLTHLALVRARPLVLMFCGPSGHGKTELANQMATLLSCPFQGVDCTEMKYETDLFGPKHPYVGSTEGSKVNNFLEENSAQRSVVFLDEFEKTSGNLECTSIAL